MRILLLTLLITPSTLRSESRQVMEGWVSDSACGARHAQPGNENCVRLCIRGGAPPPNGRPKTWC